MRRSGPLRRYAALVSRTPLARVSLKRKRKPAVPKATKTALEQRSAGWCEGGLPGCSRVATDPHHRQLVGMGGRHGAAKVQHDSLSGLLHLCRACHEYVTSASGARREYALDTGLVVLQHETPAEVPVTTPALTARYGGPVYLADDGSVSWVDCGEAS